MFKDYFWWLETVYQVAIKPFYWIVLVVLVFTLPFVRVWWWLLTPIILMFPLKTLYRWWIAWDHWYKQGKWVMLEIIPPKEILTPFKAMEDVFSVMWTIYDDSNWRETWCEGQLPHYPYWASWEIVSIEGEVHFYVRLLDVHRHILESVIYSHYPEVEISEVPDYTKNIPQNIPNKEWDLYGSDFYLLKEDAYPIKTYSAFFEPSGERISKEEKRIDPIISLLEDMAILGPGEQAWLQIMTVPITDKESSWREEAKKIINKIARRPAKKSKSTIEKIGDMASEIISGPLSAEEARERSLSASASEEGEREMLITPGEREVISAIEEKMKKAAFKTSIRGIYVAKRDNFDNKHRKVVESYFPHFYTQNLNVLKYGAKTRTKVHYIWRNRRKYSRQRKIFRNYVERFAPLFPRLASWGTFILTAEELTTLYHFPTRITALTAPTVPRVEAKKGGPPSGLPTE